MHQPLTDRPVTRRRRRIGWLALLALLLWCIILGWKIDRTGAETDPRPAQAAIILGAAAYDARPSPVFAERLNHGLTLYRRGQVPILMLTGGRGEGARFSEAAVGRRYLLARGVPARAIRLEERSRTTRQNLTEARRILAPAGITRVLVVSDPPHVHRALAMARGHGFDARAAPTPTSAYRSWQTRLPFVLREILFVHIWWAIGE
jgi:uncharacterized SAM-binding protein YcdF (DUF218 family)